MILVVGGIADRVTELVCARLASMAIPYRLLDLGRFPLEHHVRWRWGAGRPRGWIRTAEWRLDLEDVTAVFARYLGLTGRVAIPDRAPEVDAAIRAETDAGVIALVETLPCLVVNRLAGGMTNHSKVLQGLVIREVGLRIPPTLVTDDPTAARAFIEAYDGNVVFKSLSGARSIVQAVGPRQMERLDLLDHGPSQFQLRIEGDDLRVHVVGDQVFATRIRSSVVDYRFAYRAGAEPALEATALSADLADACVRLTARLDLAVAGIDLKVTASGEPYCLEVNPSPGFIYYEQRTGQPISAAVAELLRNPGARWGRGVAMPRA
jgi:glutathione synthase/RimK-type ligase-like ATP-grasp enzyme